MRKRGEKKFGTRCEIKNLKSFRNIEKAIRYEMVRQIDVLEGGGKIQQETLQFDPASARTKSMRTKEDAMITEIFPSLI